MPAVRVAFGVNTALLPTGSSDRSAVSDEIRSPSRSPAVMLSDSCWVSVTDAVAAADTAGARSTLPTSTGTIVEPAPPALLAMNETLNAAERASFWVGVHVKVPEDLAPLGTNAALCPAGSADISATKD